MGVISSLKSIITGYDSSVYARNLTFDYDNAKEIADNLKKITKEKVEPAAVAISGAINILNTAEGMDLIGKCNVNIDEIFRGIAESINEASESYEKKAIEIKNYSEGHDSIGEFLLGFATTPLTILLGALENIGDGVFSVAGGTLGLIGRVLHADWLKNFGKDIFEFKPLNKIFNLFYDSVLGKTSFFSEDNLLSLIGGQQMNLIPNLASDNILTQLLAKFIFKGQDLEKIKMKLNVDQKQKKEANLENPDVEVFGNSETDSETESTEQSTEESTSAPKQKTTKLRKQSIQ